MQLRMSAGDSSGRRCRPVVLTRQPAGSSPSTADEYGQAIIEFGGVSMGKSGYALLELVPIIVMFSCAFFFCWFLFVGFLWVLGVDVRIKYEKAELM